MTFEVRSGGMMIEQAYLTIEQVAEYLHMTTKSVQRKVQSGEIKAYKPGKRLLFKLEEIEKWIKRYPAA
jgi:excisionase family DNA binding protein